LQLNKLQLTERLKDLFKVLLGDGEVNVADIETVEWNARLLLGCAFCGSSLSVLLSLGELGDDRDAEKLLSREVNGSLHGRLVLELDIANAAARLALDKGVSEGSNQELVMEHIRKKG
jgi:hypothetical protein